MSSHAIDPRGQAVSEHLVREVVGAPLTAVEASVAIGHGVIALLLSGAMPVLLGALAQEHRLAVGQIGETAMAEALTMGLTAAVCGALLRPRRLRVIGLSSAAVLAVINLAMLWAAGAAVIGLRAVAGVAEGVLLWITIGMIARSETPERWAGVFYSVLTLCQLALTAALTGFVTPHWRANGGFALTAGLVLLASPIAWLGRNRYAALAGESAAGSLPPRGWVALAGNAFYASAFSAAGIYAVPLAVQAGVGPRVGGVAVTISLAVQIAGSALATALAGRIHYFTVFLLTTLASLAGWAVFMFWPPAWMFVAAAAVVGFVYMMGTPFLVPMTIEADPSRRAAVQSGGAQLFGAAFGPFLASRVAGERDIHGVLVMAALLLICGLAICGFLHLTARRD